MHKFNISFIVLFMFQSDKTIVSIAYLPPIEWFAAIYYSNNIVLEKFEHYIKQTYRNRCEIYSANGKQVLTIPVKKIHGKKMLIKDVRIDYDLPWQKIHWKSIESSYQSSAYFMYYKDELYPFYHNKNPEFLFDFNFGLIQLIIDFLNLNYKIEFSGRYHPDYPIAISDFRDINPKYRQTSENFHFKPFSYNQVFIKKYGFIENLSVIDLLFNTGPDAGKIISSI